MAEYTLAHFSASASRIDMEDTVSRHGGFEVKGYDISKLTVAADEKTVQSFQTKYPNWIVTKKTPAP